MPVLTLCLLAAVCCPACVYDSWQSRRTEVISWSAMELLYNERQMKYFAQDADMPRCGLDVRPHGANMTAIRDCIYVHQRAQRLKCNCLRNSQAGELGKTATQAWRTHSFTRTLPWGHCSYLCAGAPRTSPRREEDTSQGRKRAAAAAAAAAAAKAGKDSSGGSQ